MNSAPGPSRLSGLRGTINGPPPPLLRNMDQNGSLSFSAPGKQCNVALKFVAASRSAEHNHELQFLQGILKVATLVFQVASGSTTYDGPNGPYPLCRS